MSIPFRTDRVRIIIFVKRKPGLSKEEFSRYWKGPHAELFTSLETVKKNVIKYEQAHVNDKYITAPQAMAMGLTAPDWDGFAVFDAESYDKLFEVFSSEEYAKIAVPDEENFIDRPKFQILPLDLFTPIILRYTISAS
ncbi:hypothetical protein D9615_000971 [Tricholomella constricta]|uniref:EthD domain-containing protein n=1 Tax=Tricholomella constricta TaxID=117010 RepID=A0A8H5M8Z2_9AGAR|nr:hypothetical protein D9615_000971 [Tricholomella constricta]